MKKNKNAKPNKLMGAGIAMICAAVLIIGGGLFFIISDNNDDEITPKSFAAVGEEDSATACQNLMEKYYSAIMGDDGEAYFNLMAPPEYWDYYMETYGKTRDEVIATYSDAISNTKASWKSQCGNDAKVSFQIISSGEQSEEFLKNWNENVNSSVGEGILNAEEAVTLNINQTVTGSSGTIETATSPILIKINGSWYISYEGIDEN